MKRPFGLDCRVRAGQITGLISWNPEDNFELIQNVTRCTIHIVSRTARTTDERTGNLRPPFGRACEA